LLAKLSVLVICMALCACALLAARQLRMQAAHELTEARLRAMKHDNDLWRIKSRIAARVTPEQVERMAAEIQPLKSIASESLPPLRVGGMEIPQEWRP
jgi:hypothetical protein